MRTFKINPTKTFLPHSVTNGSVEQRMRKARLFNMKFYDNLQDSIRNNEIAPRTFIGRLREVVGTNLGVDITPVDSIKDSFMMYMFNGKGSLIGYNLGLPLAFYTEKVHKNTAQIFLKETQNMFNELFNPKIVTRYISLLNKGYDLRHISNFYKQNIAQKAELTPEALETYFKGKSNQEKIETLQFFRYKLMSEKNTNQTAYQIDTKIQKYNNLQYEYASDHYNIDKYHYDSKFELLNSELLETIKLERNKG